MLRDVARLRLVAYTACCCCYWGGVRVWSDRIGVAIDGAPGGSIGVNSSWANEVFYRKEGREKKLDVAVAETNKTSFVF